MQLNKKNNQNKKNNLNNKWKQVKFKLKLTKLMKNQKYNSNRLQKKKRKYNN